MLQLSNAYTNKKILSLHNGAVIGNANEPVINPENLKIEGWFCDSKLANDECIVLTQDVREYSKDGFIVNSHVALTPQEDLIRLKRILNIRFDLIGKKVVTESKSKVGVIVDYAVDSDSLFIQKMYVDPPLLKSLSFSQEQKIIDRNSIVEITDREIIVKDNTVKNPQQAAAPASA